MERYHVPNIQEISSQLAGCTIFSRINLLKAVHHIPLNLADIPMTAIITHIGLFEYVLLSFGLWNAAQTFQSCIDKVLLGMSFAYIDDLVSSTNTVSHHQHLEEDITRLRDFGIQINADKYEFGAFPVDFFGPTVDSTGITSLKPRCAAL